MKYKFCLFGKDPNLDVVPCSTVVPENFKIEAEFQTKIDTSEFPEVDKNSFGCPNMWVFDFTDKKKFVVRPKSLQENLEPIKDQKRKYIESKFIEATRKGSETCYVITSITSKLTGEKIVMDNAEIDLTNITNLIKLMKHYDQDTTTITDYHNIYHPGVTIAEVEEIEWSMILRGAELHTKKKTIRDQIDSASTAEEVNAIDWDYPKRKK